MTKALAVSNPSGSSVLLGETKIDLACGRGNWMACIHVAEAINDALFESRRQGRRDVWHTLSTEEITNAVIMAIGDSEGEPLGLRAATILTAIRDKL